MMGADDGRQGNQPTATDNSWRVKLSPPCWPERAQLSPACVVTSCGLNALTLSNMHPDSDWML